MKTLPSANYITLFCLMISSSVMLGLLLLIISSPRASGQAITVAAPDQLGGIAGLVRDSFGTPIAGAEVRLIRGRFEEYAVTATNSDGTYQFVGIPTGIYHLRFVVPDRCYFVQWYGQGTTQAEANDLIVNGDLRIGVDVTLTAGSCITGTITLEEQVPAHDGTVTVYVEQNSLWQPLDSVPISSTGRYQTHALAPGMYRICAHTEHPVADSCYGGSSITQAADVTVPLSNTLLTVDLAMPVGPFNSVISGVVTADGQPQPAIEVNLYNDLGARRLVYAVTDSWGRYQFAGLEADVYLLGIHDPNGVFATTFYTGAISLDQANLIHLHASAVISNLNLALVAGGTLQGKAPRGFSSNRYNYAFLYWQRGERPTIGPSWQWSGRSCEPNAQGEFSFDALPPGRYRLGFGENCYNLTDSCVDEFYGGTDSLWLAQDVIIEAGKITQIDAAHDFAKTLFLPIVQKGNR